MELKRSGNRGESLGIGDVSKICGVPVHTIRYWEKEFSEFLHPRRTQGKQRRFSDDDLRKLVRIKTLLWTQRFSIRAAKRILAAGDGQAGIGATRLETIDTSRLLMRLAQFAGGSAVVSGQVA
ncbi:MAG: MerR family transcriptional regulator [Chitinivibrionales bacterium]|nr:MerR family transcriptional regulator [Chitinivibrionales bacterium]MBD3396545.1 MerR family transcriptional regulator [Chitinivibrionales bacterium]